MKPTDPRTSDENRSAQLAETAERYSKLRNQSLRGKIVVNYTAVEKANGSVTYTTDALFSVIQAACRERFGEAAPERIIEELEQGIVLEENSCDSNLFLIGLTGPLGHWQRRVSGVDIDLFDINTNTKLICVIHSLRLETVVIAGTFLEIYEELRDEYGIDDSNAFFDILHDTYRYMKGELEQ